MSILDILTPDWLKNTALGGVDLTLDDGSTYDDRVYEDSLRVAVEAVEHDLGIQLDRFTHDSERHDYSADDGLSFWPFSLDWRPLIAVRSLGLQYGQNPLASVPLSWVNVLNHEHAQIQIIPTRDGLGGFQAVSGMPLIIGELLNPRSWIPGYFVFGYEAGFQDDFGTVEIPEGESRVEVSFSERMNIRYGAPVITPGEETRGITQLRVVDQTPTGFVIRSNRSAVGGPLVLDWNVTTLPSDLKRVIGYLAAMLPLDIAGDLIGGAGIANFSVSMDGLSQSVGTTSSATNSGYGSRVIQFQKELKNLLPALRAKYRKPGLMAI